ncbi:hypothetical protein ZWY2020_021404 [Hordeum vulgare]|nr:hypothetical protein ZWY2020_021404 [Hordeum vulgare]
MWSISHSRNRLTHGEEQLDPVNSVRQTREALTLLDIPRHHALVLSGFGWHSRESGFIKINMDAAIKREDDRGGARGIAHSLSSFLGAWSKPYPG